MSASPAQKGRSRCPIARAANARGESVACDPSRFIDELGDDVRQPEKPTTADAKASGSESAGCPQAMLG